MDTNYTNKIYEFKHLNSKNFLFNNLKSFTNFYCDLDKLNISVLKIKGECYF